VECENKFQKNAPTNDFTKICGQMDRQTGIQAYIHGKANTCILAASHYE
jgi:hypothetical protein